PWTIPILLLALGVAFAAIFFRVQPMVFGESEARRLPHAPALLPVFAHLAIVLLLGLYIPPYLADWYRAAARLIGGPSDGTPSFPRVSAMPMRRWWDRAQALAGAPS